MRAMERLLGEAMDAGAFGFSTGLVYAPSAYSDTAELIALARSMSRRGGYYFTHIRGESSMLLDSINEAIRIGEAVRRATQAAISAGVGGFILPNDRVDVILSGRDREAEKATGTETHVSATILTDIRVLAIDQLVQEKDGQRVVVGKTATLELTQKQAELLARAKQTGVLSLALRSIADIKTDDQQLEPTGKRGEALNVVRYGVASQQTMQK